MKRLVTTAALTIALLSSPALAGPKVYSGNEARAISCAHMIFTTGYIGFETGHLSRRDAEKMQLYAIYILEKYTSGNQKQKVKAMKIMAKRKGLAQTGNDFVKRSKSCVKRFPIR